MFSLNKLDYPLYSYVLALAVHLDFKLRLVNSAAYPYQLTINGSF